MAVPAELSCTLHPGATVEIICEAPCVNIDESKLEVVVVVPVITLIMVLNKVACVLAVHV
jgi:hypothetical protein